MRKMEALTHSVTHPRSRQEMVKTKGRQGQVFEAESVALVSDSLWGGGEVGALLKLRLPHVKDGVQEETSRLEGKIMSSGCPDVSKPLS